MNIKEDLQEENALMLRQSKVQENPTYQLFTIDDEEFDTSTYKGRFQKNRLICNPFIAFYSNSRIVEMQNLI